MIQLCVILWVKRIVAVPATSVIPVFQSIIHERNMETFKTHPSGISVELLQYMGTDLDIVNNARVSYGKESLYERWRINPRTQEFQKFEEFNASHEHMGGLASLPIEWCGWHNCLSARDSGILNYMMREKHGSPFEAVVFRFRVHVPIAVGREWMRHRISSTNEISTRYVEWEKEYYIPELEDWRTQVGKPGHYEFVSMEPSKQHPASVIYEIAMEQAFNYYQMLLKFGVAKEVARNVLPLGSFTTFIWTVNLRSLFNFLVLRTGDSALREIRIPATMVEDLAKTVVPEAFNAWYKHEKQTP